MNMRSIMDFSRETRFQDQLLERIKAECFGRLSDEDLDFVNAAGVISCPGADTYDKIFADGQENGGGQA